MHRSVKNFLDFLQLLPTPSFSRIGAALSPDTAIKAYIKMNSFFINTIVYVCRCMLDRICTSFLTLGEKGEAIQPEIAKEKEEKPKGKLSYLEKKEYEAIEGKIEKLEEEVKSLNHLLEKAQIAEDPKKLNEVCQAIGLAENQIEQLYLRFEELDKKSR